MLLAGFGKLLFGGGVRHILTLLESVPDPPAIAVQTGVLNRRDPALEPKGGIFGYTGPVFGYLKPRCGPIRQGRLFCW